MNIKTKELLNLHFASARKQRGELKVDNTWAPHPRVFFVSVASKGLSPAVSLLFATLAGKSISVAAKGFRKASRWRESNWNGREEFEGVRRTAWRTSILSRHGRIILVPYVKGYLQVV